MYVAFAKSLAEQLHNETAILENKTPQEKIKTPI